LRFFPFLEPEVWGLESRIENAESRI